MTAITRRLPTALVVLLVLCRAASADQFTVTGGSLTLVDRFDVDFSLTGDGFSLGGVAVPITLQESCLPCGPSLPSITISGSVGNPNFAVFGGAPGTFSGVDYPHIFLTGQMSVSTPSFPGSMLLDSRTITLPFDFSARLRGFPNSFNPVTSPDPTPIFDNDMFAGSGTATLNFTAGPPGPVQLFDLHDATFVFGASSTAPTPEPATVTLLVIGAATAFLRRRKCLTSSGEPHPTRVA